MNWNSMPQKLPVHLGRFADQLSDLSQEVRTSVAALAGDATGRAVRDVLLGHWRGSEQQMRPTGRSGWSRNEWDDEDQDWEQPPEQSSESESSIIQFAPKLALALQAAGWLLQHGTLVGLLGTGLGVGGLALLRRQLKPSHSEFICGVADVASLLMLLNSGAKSLRNR